MSTSQVTVNLVISFENDYAASKWTLCLPNSSAIISAMTNVKKWTVRHQKIFFVAPILVTHTEKRFFTKLSLVLLVFFCVLANSRQCVLLLFKGTQWYLFYWNLLRNATSRSTWSHCLPHKSACTGPKETRGNNVVSGANWLRRCSHQRRYQNMMKTTEPFSQTSDSNKGSMKFIVECESAVICRLRQYLPQNSFLSTVQWRELTFWFPLASGRWGPSCRTQHECLVVLFSAPPWIDVPSELCSHLPPRSLRLLSQFPDHHSHHMTFFHRQEERNSKQ